jgi:putative membrane protein
MSRYLRYLVLIVLTLVLLVVALANRGSVLVSLLPDDLAALVGWQARAEVPLFLVLAAGAVAGIALGFVWEWLREHKHRKVARVQTRAVSRLEQELAAMKDQNSLPDDPVLALLEKPKAR